MERIVRTLEMDGHVIAVIESLEEEGSLFTLWVDNVVINADAPLASVPSDEDARTAALLFLARR